jgi:hypothetical protein
MNEETTIGNCKNYSCEILHCVSWIRLDVYSIVVEVHVRINSPDKQSIGDRVEAVSYQSTDTVMDGLERLKMNTKSNINRKNFIRSVKCYQQSWASSHPPTPTPSFWHG